MIRLPQAIAAVIACTLASGAAGGIVGAAVGRLAPSFVQWLHSPVRGERDPVEFGFGLGVVCGLLMGAAAGVFLVCVLALRDAWLAAPWPDLIQGGADRGGPGVRRSLAISPADRVHQPFRLDEPGRIDLMPFPLGRDALADRPDDLVVGRAAAEQRADVGFIEGKQAIAELAI